MPRLVSRRRRINSKYQFACSRCRFTRCTAPRRTCTYYWLLFLLSAARSFMCSPSNLAGLRSGDAVNRYFYRFLEGRRYPRSIPLEIKFNHQSRGRFKTIVLETRVNLASIRSSYSSVKDLRNNAGNDSNYFFLFPACI